MWCTLCQTSFSWRTGRRLSGVVHNPHFFEWQRSRGAQGRDLADTPCGGMPAPRELATAMRRRGVYGQALAERMLLMQRLVLHVEHVERPRYDREPAESRNRDLRVRYILGELTEAEFMRDLQRMEKADNKSRCIAQILIMLQDTMTDLFRQLVLDGDVMSDVEALVGYANRALMDVARQYDCVVPQLDTLAWTVRHERAAPPPR
jgi:hypothetical protein